MVPWCLHSIVKALAVFPFGRSHLFSTSQRCCFSSAPRSVAAFTRYRWKGVARWGAITGAWQVFFAPRLCLGVSDARLRLAGMGSRGVGNGIHRLRRFQTWRRSLRGAFPGGAWERGKPRRSAARPGGCRGASTPLSKPWQCSLSVDPISLQLLNKCWPTLWATSKSVTLV